MYNKVKHWLRNLPHRISSKIYSQYGPLPENGGDIQVRKWLKCILHRCACAAYLPPPTATNNNAYTTSLLKVLYNPNRSITGYWPIVELSCVTKHIWLILQAGSACRLGPNWVWWLTAILPIDSRIQLTLLSMNYLKDRLEALEKILTHLQRFWLGRAPVLVTLLGVLLALLLSWLDTHDMVQLSWIYPVINRNCALIEFSSQNGPD